MTQVGQVSVGLGLDDAKFKKGLKDAEGQTLKFAKIMQKTLGLIGVGFSIKAVIDGVNKSVEAYRTQVIAVKQLNNALINAGQYSDEYTTHLQTLASQLQKVTNYGDEVTLKAIAQGQAFAGNVKLTDELIKATMDFASATGTDLDTAFKLVGKSVGSQTNALARYGIELDKNASKQDKIIALQTQLGQKFKGSASDMQNSSIQLKNAVGDLSESFGAFLNPSIQVAEKLLIRLVNWVDNGVKAINRWYGSYIEWVAQLRGIDAEILKQKMGYTDLSKAITSNAKNTIAANDQLADSYKNANDEYDKFVKQFQQATNQYEATLKARNYVEKTLGFSPIGLEGGYDEAIQIYTNYFQQLTEIQQSNAINKNSLLLQLENKLQQDLTAMTLKQTEDRLKQQWDLISSYQAQQKELEIEKQAELEAGGFLGSFATGYSERLNILKWYYAERDKIINTNFVSEQDKIDAFNMLSALKLQKQANLELDLWKKRGMDVKNIFSSTLSQMLTNYGDFGDNMKQLALNLTNYIIGQMFQMMIASATFKSILGGIGSFFGFHSGGTILPTASKHHYGGNVIPKADQTEHFALLKNNERVLSPAETSAYNSGQQQANPNYIVYAPQVRAMDSKDVAQWFNENKQQIIGIVSTGIRDNNQGLRTQIQGV